MSTEELARFMYGRNVGDFTDDPALLDEMWEVDSVRSFWIDEAQAVMDYLFGKGTF